MKQNWCNVNIDIVPAAFPPNKVRVIGVLHVSAEELASRKNAS